MEKVTHVSFPQVILVQKQQQSINVFRVPFLLDAVPVKDSLRKELHVAGTTLSSSILHLSNYAY